MRYKETVSPETTRPETRPKMNIAIVKRLSKTAPITVNVIDGIKYEVNSLSDIV
jgi:hypothetical protein